MVKVLCAAVAVLSLSSAAFAVRPCDCVCPACGAQFKAITSSTDRHDAGEDRDLLPRAYGEQPILYTPITCPQCLFTGYEAEFAAGNKLDESAKQRVAKDKVLKLPAALPQDTAGDKLPAWARYDLLGQTCGAVGKPGFEQAFAWLAAGWAARLEWTLPNKPSEADLKEYEAWEAKYVDPEKLRKSGDPAAAEVRLAEDLQKQAKRAKGRDRMFPGLLALYLFRTHGENRDALAMLPTLKEAFAAEEHDQLSQSLNATIELEQTYQRRALGSFEVLMPTLKDVDEQAAAVYLCGELSRRLGDNKAARTWFAALRKLKPTDKLVLQWGKEQEARCR